MQHLKHLWHAIHESFWFVPGLVVLGAMALALGMIEADTRISNEALAAWPRVFGAGAEGSRGMLSAIASSMITVVGVTFSITIVALTLASTQYTPRILRNFIRDRRNQVVLGVFVGIFAYCLIVLRTVRGTDEVTFVPGLAVFVGVVLALVGVGALIYFIHHITVAMQSSTILEAITDETLEAIDHLFPSELGAEADAEALAAPARPLPALTWYAVPACQTGYVQNVDTEELLRFACAWGVVLRMERGIGDFVIQHAPLLSLAGAGQPDEETIQRLNEMYAIDRHRTVEQDAGFGILQLTDIALKALSPGVNDTTTAVMCVDHLTAILARLAERRIPSPYRSDGGQVQVLAQGPTFASLLAQAFDPVRRNAEGNFQVLTRMLDGLEILAGLSRQPHQRRALRQQLDLLVDLVHRSLKTDYDHAAIETASARVVRGLGATSSRGVPP